MEASFIPQILKNLFFLLPHLLVLIACIYYMAKRAGADSVLMTIGTFLTFLTSIFYMIILPIFWSYGSDSFSTREIIISAVGFVGFIGNVMFGVGLLLLIIKQVKRVV